MGFFFRGWCLRRLGRFAVLPGVTVRCGVACLLCPVTFFDVHLGSAASGLCLCCVIAALSAATSFFKSCTSRWRSSCSWREIHSVWEVRQRTDLMWRCAGSSGFGLGPQLSLSVPFKFDMSVFQIYVKLIF